MEAQDEIRVEYVSMSEIAKWPRNPKDHDHHEIQKSFYRFGFVKPVLIDEGTGQLVAGHGRLDTLKILKNGNKKPPRGVQVVDDIWLIPVLRGVKFDNPAEAEAFLMADNRLSEIGGWNQDLLAEMLGEIADIDGAIDGIGFDYAEIMDMLNPKQTRGNIDGSKKANEAGENYLIIVVCEDEEQQSDLLERFMEEGIQCKGVIE